MGQNDHCSSDHWDVYLKTTMMMMMMMMMMNATIDLIYLTLHWLCSLVDEPTHWANNTTCD